MTLLILALIILSGIGATKEIRHGKENNRNEKESR